MAVVGGLRVDRTAQLELADDLGGLEAEGLLHRGLDGLLGNRGGAEGVDVDRDGIGMADRVGELNLAACGETGCYDILGHVAAHVGCGTVYLGRILSGEGASAVATHATIGVDDDLAAGETGVALGSADDEAARGVDQKLRLLGEHLGGKDLADHLLDAEFLDLLVGNTLGVLGGNDDIDDAGRLPVDILDGDLALRIGAKPLGGTALAEAGQFAAEAMSIHDRRGHQFGRLVAGVAEHESLVARTLLGGLLAIGLLGVDPLGDVGALGGDDVVDEDGVCVEDVVAVVVADLTDRIADDLSKIQDRLEGLLAELGNGDLTADHHDVALGIGLAGNAAHRIECQAGIEDGVGNGVADLVGMALADGFGREDVAT